MLGTYQVIFVAITCYIGGYSAIFIIGYPSPTQKQLLQENILNYYTLPIFPSIIHIGKIIGLIIFPCLVQTNVSINVIVVVNCIIGAVGWVLIIMADSPIKLICGVCLMGLYSGITNMFINTYIPEISLDVQRRLLATGIGFSYRTGLFIAYFAGILLSFRWLAVVGLSFVVLFAMLILFIPHSPVWFVRMGLNRWAENSLLHLHGNNFDAGNEIQKIQSVNASAQMNWKDSLKALGDLKVLKPIILVTTLAIFKEVGGHSAMVSFSSQILENQHGIDPKVGSLFYPIFLIFGSILCICILSYCKLKWLLIFASSIQAFSVFSMAIYYLVSEQYIDCKNGLTLQCQMISFWLVCNIAVYAFAQTLGLSSIVYTLMGIMYTSHREISSSITEIVTNITSYVVIISFYFLLNVIGGFWTFLILGIIHLIAVAFEFIFLQI